MATTARIFIEGEPMVIFKKADGYPEVVVGNLHKWLADGRPVGFLEYIEAVRQTQYPVTWRVITPEGVSETVVEYEQIHFDQKYRGPKQQAWWQWDADYEYTVTIDGRIFEGREL